MKQPDSTPRRRARQRVFRAAHAEQDESTKWGPARLRVGAGAVERASLARETFVLYNRTSHTFQLVSEYFQRERVPLANMIEPGSMEAIKELVKIGVGVLAPWIAQQELDSGALVALPIGPRRLTRQWGVAYTRTHTPTLAEQTFIGLCRALTEETRFNAPLAAS